MTKGEFWIKFFDMGFEPYLILLVVTLVYLWIHRKYVYSIIDPLILSLIYSGMSNSVVLILYRMEAIELKTLWIHFLAQIFFVIGFFSFKPFRLEKVSAKRHLHEFSSGATLKVFFHISLIVMLASSTFIYGYFGVPLFMEGSRLALLEGAGSLGHVKRFMDVSLSVTLFLSIYYIFSDKGTAYLRLIAKFAIFSTIIVLSLSGSRSSILGVIFTIFFVFMWLIRDEGIDIRKKVSKRFIFSIGVFAIILATFITAQHRSEADLWVGVYGLLQRFVNAGDVFMLGYPQNNYLYMVDHNPLYAIFRGPLGYTGLFETSKSLGHEIFDYVYGGEYTIGPNPRHNFFGLVYFGFPLMIFYSYFLGYLFSFFRNYFLRHLPNGIFWGVLYFLLVRGAASLESDVGLFVANIINTIAVVGLLILLSFLIASAKNKSYFHSSYESAGISNGKGVNSSFDI